MKFDKYILDEDGNPKGEPDFMAWAKWFEENSEKRIVARTKVGKHTVSTVFLGLEHNFGMEGKPILWETMVFADDRKPGEDIYEFTERHVSKEEAQEYHNFLVKKLEKTPQ